MGPSSSYWDRNVRGIAQQQESQALAIARASAASRRANSHVEAREFSRELLDPVDVKRPIDGDEIRRAVLLGPCLMHHLRRHVAE